MKNTCAIGVDVEDVSRFKKLDRIADRTLLNKLFTEDEIRYCFSKKNYAESLAARFSAKESIIKALASFNVQRMDFRSIEIRRDRIGRPTAKLLGDKLRKYSVRISISHTSRMVLTAAVAARKL